jgi:hypothetical protein
MMRDCGWHGIKDLVHLSAIKFKHDDVRVLFSAFLHLHVVKIVLYCV